MIQIFIQSILWTSRRGGFSKWFGLEGLFHVWTFPYLQNEKQRWQHGWHRDGRLGINISVDMIILCIWLYRVNSSCSRWHQNFGIEPTSNRNDRWRAFRTAAATPSQRKHLTIKQAASRGRVGGSNVSVMQLRCPAALGCAASETCREVQVP